MNVIVFGDVMIDINFFSKIERKAPEADISIHNIYDTKYVLGGAANVAHNLNNLHVNVELISVIGNDNYGTKIQSLLDEKSIKHKLFIDKTRKTTSKNRIFNNNLLHVRYDIEDKDEINTVLSSEIFNYIKSKNITTIVISDYDKGVVNETLVKNIINYSNENNIYTFIDPKTTNYLKYQNCFCFKPNLLESKQISNKNTLSEIINVIKEVIKCENLIITQGEDGIILNHLENKIKSDEVIDVVDVTGSGDIVMSLLVYVFIIHKDLLLACKVANYIAGLGVKTIGNYTICKEEVDNCLNLELNAIENKNNKQQITITSFQDNYQDKIVYANEIDKIKDLSKKKNIVFTNGCFDILHSAHIKLLQYSKKQGDILVVGLNTDDSIKRLKGMNRPINNLSERMTILTLFDFIDYIIIYDDDTPLNILKILTPDILIKGSDYNIENIIGKEYSKKVLFFDLINNKSTSIIIEKIKNCHNIK